MVSAPRILLLSFYFEPDLSAGSFRAAALSRALIRNLPAGGRVDVITTLPNRYSTFTIEVPQREERGALTITRIGLRKHRSGMVDQSLAYVAFARAAAGMARRQHYDVVFATSSRLATAVLGSWIARTQRAPLYLDIRDIFVDTIKDVLRGPTGVVLSHILPAAERFAVARASRVNLVSEGFAPYFRKHYPTTSLSFFTNGIDDEFVGLAAQSTHVPANHPLRVVYAGNMGDGQGLHAIIPEVATRLRGRVEFILVGDGGRRDQLQQALEGMDNVRLLPPMRRPELLQEYLDADVLFLHLNDYDAFRKVLPSKIFEYAATGKPIWAGVGGYAARFLHRHVENAAVFTPCDVDGAVRALETLDLRTIPRSAFVERYSREAISDEMARDILALRGAPPSK